MIRNFPHQINNIQKLHGALVCADKLINANQGIADDGAYGYALARQGVYAFQGLRKGQSLESRIVEEQAKPESRQGARTSARDLRRTLRILGLLDEYEDIWQLTPRGTTLVELGHDMDNPEYKALWQDAVLQIVLESEGTPAFKPTQMMLEVISKLPGVEKRWLALVFAADNNTASEVERIVRIIESGDFAAAISDTGSTEYQAANAVKILPSLLEQVGVIDIDSSSHCSLRELGQELNAGIREVVKAKPRQRAQRRGRTLRTRLLADVVETQTPTAPTARSINYSAERQALAIKRTGVRYRAHQRILTIVGEALSPEIDESKFTDDSYDLLVLKGANILQIEAKSIGERDELKQARLGLGQLFFYDFFDVEPAYQGNRMLAIAFDKEPGSEAREFLQHHNIHTIVILEGSVVVPSELSAFFKTA